MELNKTKKDGAGIIYIIIIVLILLSFLFVLFSVYANIRVIGIIHQTDKCMDDTVLYAKNEISKRELCDCPKIVAEKAQDPIVRVYYGQNQAEEWRKLYEYCEKNL